MTTNSEVTTGGVYSTSLLVSPEGFPRYSNLKDINQKVNTLIIIQNPTNVTIPSSLDEKKSSHTEKMAMQFVLLDRM